MATKITKWLAIDGSEWNTKEAAEKQDARHWIAVKIEAMTIYGKVDPEELLTELTTGHLGKLVANYLIVGV